MFGSCLGCLGCFQQRDTLAPGVSVLEVLGPKAKVCPWQNLVSRCVFIVFWLFPTNLFLIFCSTTVFFPEGSSSSKDCNRDANRDGDVVAFKHRGMWQMG